MPKVFIIIVNWNGWKDTAECLESLKEVTYSNFEVILVDNGSADTSVSEIKNPSYATPSPKATEVHSKASEGKQKSKIKNFVLTLIENKNNLGFAGGNNVGIKYALENNADYVLLLNNDTTVDGNFLGKLIETAESNANFGILGPRIYYYGDSIRQAQGKPQKIWYDGGKMNWFCGNTHIGFNKLDENVTRKDIVTLTEYISGCAMLIKKGVLKKIGLFYEPFFLYYEDVDFCLRARRTGYNCAVIQQSKIWHKISQSTKTLNKPIFHYYNHRNILLLAKRNRPLFFYCIMIPWSAWKFFKQLIKLAITPSTKPISLAIMTGIKDFYKGNFGQKPWNKNQK